MVQNGSISHETIWVLMRRSHCRLVQPRSSIRSWVMGKKLRKNCFQGFWGPKQLQMKPISHVSDAPWCAEHVDVSFDIVAQLGAKLCSKTWKNEVLGGWRPPSPPDGANFAMRGCASLRRTFWYHFRVCGVIRDQIIPIFLSKKFTFQIFNLSNKMGYTVLYWMVVLMVHLQIIKIISIHCWWIVTNTYPECPNLIRDS